MILDSGAQDEKLWHVNEAKLTETRLHDKYVPLKGGHQLALWHHDATHTTSLNSNFVNFFLTLPILSYIFGADVVDILTQPPVLKVWVLFCFVF